jgi:zinc-ribbon domain
MKCPACDASAPKGARFCPSCGAAMTAAAPEQAAPRAASDDDLRAARAFADEAAQRHIATTQESLGATLAKGAAIGAVISIPMPFIGPIAGAIVGAGVAAFKKFSED